MVVGEVARGGGGGVAVNPEHCKKTIFGALFRHSVSGFFKDSKGLSCTTVELGSLVGRIYYTVYNPQGGKYGTRKTGSRSGC